MTNAEAQAWLTEQSRIAGVPVSEGDVEDLARRNPEDVAGVQQAYREQYARRAAPTFSNGGTGGDVDLDGNGQADAGWTQGPRGWTRTGGPRMADLLQGVPRPATVPGMPPYGLTGHGYQRQGAPVEGPHSLSDLLAYAPSFQQFLQR